MRTPDRHDTERERHALTVAPRQPHPGEPNPQPDPPDTPVPPGDDEAPADEERETEKHRPGRAAQKLAALPLDCRQAVQRQACTGSCERARREGCPRGTRAPDQESAARA